MKIEKISPRTPVKVPDELFKITTSLAVKWNIRFPSRDTNWSPSRVKDPNAPGEQALSRMKFLNFTRKEALDYAVENFERHAKVHCSQWIHKPDADRDLLPRRAYPEASHRTPFLKQQPDIKDATAAELMTILLRILDRVADCVKNNEDYRCLSPLESLAGLSYPSKEKAAKRRGGAEKLTEAALGKLLEPSWSDDDDLDVETLGIIEQSLKKIDNAAKVDQALFRDEDDDEFNTAPNSPAPLAESPTPGKKRKYEEGEKSPESRKSPRKSPRNVAVDNLQTQHSLRISCGPSSASTVSPVASTSAIWTPHTSSFATDPSEARQSFEYGPGPALKDEMQGDRQDSFSLSHGSADVKQPSEPAPVPNMAHEDGYPAATFFPATLLSESSPFELHGRNKCAIPFRQLYEVTRISMFTKIPLTDFGSCLSKGFDDYEKLWSALGLIIKSAGQILPEKSSLKAWQKGTTKYEGVFLSGDLRFAEHRSGGPFFDFSLKPMKIEKSYRFARKFGADRFCVIGLPGISQEYLPSSLKKKHVAFRDGIINRLVDTDFKFAGRRWRAFYLKPENVKKGRRGNTAINQIKYRVYFFAVAGYDMRVPKMGEPDPRLIEHNPLSIEELIEWFMPAERNQDQTCLKFYARLALGVSSTVPTVTFAAYEIIRTRDARADAPQVRRVNQGKVEGHQKPDGNRGDMVPVNRAVMNDVSADHPNTTSRSNRIRAAPEYPKLLL